MVNFEFSYIGAGAIPVDDKGVRLPDEKAKFVRLSLHNTTADNFQTYLGGLEYQAGQELYWGFKGVYAHQLFPTQTTDLIPVENLSDIQLKTRAGQLAQVWYSFYR